MLLDRSVARAMFYTKPYLLILENELPSAKIVKNLRLPLLSYIHALQKATHIPSSFQLPGELLNIIFLFYIHALKILTHFDQMPCLNNHDFSTDASQISTPLNEERMRED